jgi:hypothetical protein
VFAWQTQQRPAASRGDKSDTAARKTAATHSDIFSRALPLAATRRNSVNCSALNCRKIDVCDWGHVMGTVSEEYQHYARECLRRAAETDDEEHRQAFLQMAKVWTQLAMHAHKIEVPSVAAAPVNGNQYRA